MNLKVHHIGYAVYSIDESIAVFKSFGFNLESDIFDDIKRKVRIVFMSKDGARIELVEPIGEDSPVSKFLSKNGASPYHICYSTDDLHDTIKELTKMRFIQISEIEEAIALSNKKVVFLYSKAYGILELVEGA